MVARAIAAGVPFSWFTADEHTGRLNGCGPDWKSATCAT